MKNVITLAHGNGGIQMQELLKQLVLPRLENRELLQQEDAAILACPDKASVVFTTDAFTVQPLFFPGGDIGHLSVCGTVNSSF